MQYHQGQYQQPMYGQPQQPVLPVRSDVADQTTFMNPGQNNVRPQLNQPRAIPSNFVDYIVGSFRQLLQDGAVNHATPLHVFAYNMMARGYFTNHDFTEWCQFATDFADFLVVRQGENNPIQTACDKAVGMAYRCYLATTAANYPQIAETIRGNQAIVQELLSAGNDITSVRTDIDLFLRSGRQPAGYGGQPHHQQQGYYQPPTQQHQGNYAVGGQAHMSPMSVAQPYQSSGPTITGGTSGRYHETPQSESWSSSQPTEVTTPQPQESVSMQYQQTTDLSHLDQQAPLNADDIIFNPDHFTPPGVNINEERPWDVIYSPGGVESRPAHLSGWKVVRTEDSPWPEAYDPEVYCLYHIRWPDGLIQEHLLEWESGMDYLKHEIDERLRRVRMKPDGKMIAAATRIVEHGEKPVPISKALDLAKDSELIAEQPIIIEDVLMGGTDLEHEERAKEILRETLDIDPEAALPAHEYQSIKAYPLVVKDECITLLQLLATSDSLPAVARGLKEGLADTVIPLRIYRLVNQRLTNEVNRVLEDCLGLTVSIDDFSEDVADLYTYLKNKGQGEYVTVLKSEQRTRSILQRTLTIEVHENEEDDSREVDLLDLFINIQTGWSSDQLESLTMGEEPTLISKTYHPKLSNLVFESLQRNFKNDTLVGRTVRLISLDGVYYTVFNGWLVEDSILIKRMSH